MTAYKIISGHSKSRLQTRYFCKEAVLNIRTRLCLVQFLKIRKELVTNTLKA
jgi:hypothetical protein